MITVSAVLKFALVMNLEMELFIPTHKTSGDRGLERMERISFVLPQLTNILISYEEFLLDFECVSYIMWKVLRYLCFCSQSSSWENRKSDLSEWKRTLTKLEECSNPKAPRGHALWDYTSEVWGYSCSATALCAFEFQPGW